MATTERHRDISALFLEHAEDEYRRGDLLQASEKAWGAVAHCVNSIARDHGWNLGTHRHLAGNVRRLIARDPANAGHRRRLLRSVESLHANFYQEFMDEESVREGIDDAKELVAALEDLARLPGED